MPVIDKPPQIVERKYQLDSSEDASCISSMAGYSTSCYESGIVSKPSTGASLGAGSELSDVRPIGTRHKETSRRVSRSSRRFTSASTNPSTISAGSPEAADTASIFASRGAVVPTEMAIGARLVLPGVPPVRSGADDRRGRVSRGLHRRRLSQVSAKISFPQKP
jgi:hypothetical protein